MLALREEVFCCRRPGRTQRGKGNEHLRRKEEKSRKSCRSSFMENFERLDHKSDKKDEGETVKGFSVVC